MNKQLKFSLALYLLSFCIPWLRVYQFLTWGGPFEAGDTGRIFYGWEVALRYWPFFLGLLLVFILTCRLSSRVLLFFLVVLGLLTSLWVVTFGDFFQVTPWDYIQLFRYHAFGDILPGYFLQFLFGSLLLYRIYFHIKQV